MYKFADKVVYQIYPKSFKDTSGNGIGDIKGITSKLDYLANLGVDYLWITPFYVSPQNDNGYDIADYYNIDPIYGTMEDFDELILEGKKRNIYIMMDMVFNHVSTEHIWFKKAMTGDKMYKDYFIWKKSNKKNLPPTNWESKFGGSVWEYVEKFDEWYLHLFDKTQADLNWENPKVRQEIQNVVNFWQQKGVKGFRFDVINLISKDKYEDDHVGDGRKFYTDGPRIHEYLKELRRNSFGKDVDIITVGEMSSTSMEECYKYAGSDTNELSMVFNFHHLKVDFMGNDKWVLVPADFAKLKEILFSWQENMTKHNAWNALFWCNHDQPRAVSRFGNDGFFREKSAKMLATIMHCLRGTPYIYQGEEIGMTNPDFKNIDEYRDVESLNYYQILQEKGMSKEQALMILSVHSRDNSRTPMQWNDDEYTGFSENAPWINVSYNYKDINVAKALSDKNSIFYYYKNLINLRKKSKAISVGSIEPLLQDHPHIFAFKRNYDNEEILVFCNFYQVNTVVEIDENLEDYKVLLKNYEDITFKDILSLRPYETIVYRKINRE